MVRENIFKLGNLSDYPFITIIMPVYNEARYIRRSLESVLTQDYPADKIEIIISDGNSTDETRQIIQEYQKSHANIILIDNPKRIVPCGLNESLRLAQGEIIIRVDGHCEISPSYVTNCVRNIQLHQVDGVGGYIETIGENMVSQAIALAMSSKFGVGGSAFRTIKNRTMQVDTIPFPAYTREIITRVGPYDEELIRNQDDEYNYRIRESGGKILLAADVRSRYYSRSRLNALWKQFFQYGFWKVRVLQKHPRQMQFRQFIPPLFTLLLLVFVILSLIFKWSLIGFLVIIAVYSLINLINATLIARRNGWKHFLILCLAYPILHISYGLGFLSGLLIFIKHWSIKGFSFQSVIL